jgi:hypothetical protein
VTPISLEQTHFQFIDILTQVVTLHIQQTKRREENHDVKMEKDARGKKKICLAISASWQPTADSAELLRIRGSLRGNPTRPFRRAHQSSANLLGDYCTWPVAIGQPPTSTASPRTYTYCRSCAYGLRSNIPDESPFGEQLVALRVLAPDILE